jgi:hypothetical protein
MLDSRTLSDFPTWDLPRMELNDWGFIHGDNAIHSNAVLLRNGTT